MLKNILILLVVSICSTAYGQYDCDNKVYARRTVESENFYSLENAQKAEAMYGKDFLQTVHSDYKDGKDVFVVYHRVHLFISNSTDGCGKK